MSKGGKYFVCVKKMPSQFFWKLRSFLPIPYKKHCCYENDNQPVKKNVMQWRHLTFCVECMSSSCTSVFGMNEEDAEKVVGGRWWLFQ